jgi:molybdate transport system ATP-binding protein
MNHRLEADVTLTLGTLRLDVGLSADPREPVAVVGPNGAGKTTLLRALAGLVPLNAGRVVLAGDVLDDPAAGVRVPPERRRVGVVFQDYLLFPHLSALDNVAFGLRARGMPRAEARRCAADWLHSVGLEDVAGAHPRHLSGGQAQRVGLARALAGAPRMLLLDEPLAALDVTTRLETRRELQRQLAGYAGVAIVVTHDPVEAAALARRLVVVEDGRVVQAGTPAEITARPRSRYAADLAGVNLLRGEGRGDHVEIAGAPVLAAPDAGRGPVLVVVHPRAVALHRRRPEGTPRNVWCGHVTGVDLEGERARVAVAGPLPMVAEVTLAAVRDLRLEQGAEVWVAVKATEIVVYPA